MTKSTLMDAAWQGMAVEEGNLTVQIASLRKLLGPSAGGGDWIATIPRVGYRFAGLVTTMNGTGDPRVEPGPSIAVLPFANLSDDTDQQYFADGLAEDITTNLARLRWLFVSARNSSFVYRGKTVDAKQVGRELGVRYVLSGSVRRSGQRLRISAELSDAATGLQTWAQRYDADLADFFTLQDLIADNVIAAIEPRLYVAEHQRLQTRSPESLDAWGFVMKAMPQVWAWFSAKEIDAAEALLKRAIEIDPEYPRANSLLAWARTARAIRTADPREALKTARDMAQQAIQRDPVDPWTHLAAGYVHLVSRRFDPGVKELSEAIELNPSLAFAHTILGAVYGHGGMPEDGLHHCAIAARLSPRDFAEAGNFGSQAVCHFVAGRFADAVECERKAVDLRPHFGPAWITLAAAAGMAGDIDVARQALSVAKQLLPFLSVDWVERYHAMVRDKDRATYIEGLRAAGLT